MSQPNDTELDTADDAEESFESIAEGLNSEEGEEQGSEQESEEQEAEEGQEAETPDDDPELEGDHGGTKVRLRKSELFAGYMKDADYRRKTAEASELRRRAESIEQQVKQEREFLVNRVDVLAQALHAELVEDTKALAGLVESDPVEYLRRQQKANERAQKLQLAFQQSQFLKQQAQADAERKQAEFAAEQNARLIERLPSWRDEKKRDAEEKEIVSFLTECGYGPQEIRGLSDHRALLVARDAMLYRKQQAARNKQDKPDPRRPLRPGAAKQTSDQSGRVRTAEERLRRNPDSIEALGALMGARGF